MINKIIFIICFILSFVNNYSKSHEVKKLTNGFEIKIIFTQHDYNINDKSEIDFIFDEDESNPGKLKLPSHSFIIAIPPESKISVEITDKIISQIHDVNISLNRKPDFSHNGKTLYKRVDEINFDLNLFPEEESKIIGYTWIREFYCAVIQINTHRYSFKERKLYVMESCNLKLTYRNNKNFMRNHEPASLFDEVLKDIIVNYKEAQEFRSFNQVMNYINNDWIDYTKSYIKLAIPSDNIYRITYSYLLNHGLNPQLINPKTFKVYFNGKELPIYVKGESDNQFNENDYIEFYCEKNYSGKDYRKIVSIGEDYIHYMNQYNDTSYIWLTWGGNNGQRIKIDTDVYTQNFDIIDYHFVKLHLEQDNRLWYYDPTEPRVQLPFWQENKLYTWLVIGNSGNVSVNFNANNILENSNVNVLIRLISYAADVSNNPNGIYNTHKIGVGVNNSSINYISYDYKQTVNFFSVFNSSELKEGNNIIKIYGIPSSVSFHQSLIDWIDVEYLRKNVVINDSLLIIIPNDVEKKLRIIKVENINCNKDELVVYKIFPNLKKYENFYLSKESNTLYIIDTVAGGYKYFIYKKERVLEPLFKHQKHFVNLRNKSKKADYIIITNKLLAESANEYKNFIDNYYGVKTELVYDEDIYDEFSYGMLDPEAIKSFLAYAYRNWQAPKPSYLTIIGDANYDYKDVTFPALSVKKKNLVPSYGFPVSDIWYVIWDTVKTAVPQMFVGRIPANNNDEVYFYLQKHQKYIKRKQDIFNKTFLFFSGGNSTKQDELQEIRNVSELLYQKFILSAPIYGKGIHFYKTLNPQTNFGPYSKEEFQKVIDEGGIFISYIGHSGTRTWDNGITEVEHIKNSYSDRFTLITDFGCSTGKFAEPDIDAFGELFICQSSNGQAIAYLGNSSWGYLSTSLRFPKYFYEILLQDSIKRIGYVHLKAKIKQLNDNGYNDVNRVFTYCNLLLGDPIVNILLPQKPNLYIDNSKIKIPSSELNDKLDSTAVKIVVSNYGLFINDTLIMKLYDNTYNNVSYEKIIKVKFPRLEDTLIVNVPIKNHPGEHNLKVELDIENKIKEIYEDDNIAEVSFMVNSNFVYPLVSNKYYEVIIDTMYILNPITKPKVSNVILQIADNYEFINSMEIIKQFDTLITKIPLDNLVYSKRYYYRFGLGNDKNHFTDIYSFSKIKSNAKLFIDEPLFESKEFIYINTNYDKSKKSWQLNKRDVSLIVKSAGWLDGSFGSIIYDNQEQLPNTYYWGLAAAIIDSITLKPHSVKYFLVPDKNVMDSVTNYINSLPQGTIVAMTICADAQQSILGNKNSKSRNAIKKLGSIYIDSVQYRDSWCIIGKKGAQLGSVPEAYKKQLNGSVQIQISKSIIYDSGYIIFPEINNVAKWNKIIFGTEKPAGSKIFYIPLAVKSNGEIDTLNDFSTYMDTIYLDKINTKKYSGIKIKAKIINNEIRRSPEIKSLEAYFSSFPDLAVNYQTISLSSDSIKLGETINYFANIYNIGETESGPFNLALYLTGNNINKVLIDTVINNLDSGSYLPFSYNYTTKQEDGLGRINFVLEIDKDNYVKEFYENNNTFVKSFYVKKDTVTSVGSINLTVKFNGQEIQDWDYVEPQSLIQINVSSSYFNEKDTSILKIVIDNKNIPLDEINKYGLIDYDVTKRTMVISFYHKFEEGEH